MFHEVLDAIGGQGAATLVARVEKSLRDIPKPAEFALLRPGTRAQSLGSDIVGARFSPGRDALLLQRAGPTHAKGASSARAAEPGGVQVMALATGAVVDLGELFDPLWDADGRHVFATRFADSEQRPGRTPAPVRRSVRVRWDRVTGVMVDLGPGSASIPAPKGEAVAWSGRPRAGPAVGACSVRLGRLGVPHVVIGAFCDGIADDRELRWSPDGAWLAIASPAPRSRLDSADGPILDVVGVAGGRYPQLSALLAKHGAPAETLGDGATRVWMDWSPSQQFLAVQDRAGELRIYDFEREDVMRLGPGLHPLWSPGGSYLLATAMEAEPSPAGEGAGAAAIPVFVFSMATPGKRIALGSARTARWLSPDACREAP